MTMRALAVPVFLLVAAPAFAQPIVVSDTIDATSVTVYHAPDSAPAVRRGAGANWPAGYALITETRTISVPAGRSVIRFVGVSEGMMPETAIVTGLPRQPAEKNRDARLLSPAALIDAYLKRRVHIRRTNRATGKVTEGEAIIQSGPRGGVLLTTADGVEALGCSGLPESLSYGGVPDDLAAKPTLSVVTDNAAAATVKVQLTYLAQGLDWSANYVLNIGEDGDTLDLFAWMTLVNGGSQGFANAATSAIAGSPDKQASAPLPRGPAPDLRLECWPMDITSTHDKWGPPHTPPPPPPAPMPEAMAVTTGDEIVVTGSRRPAGVVMSSPVAVVVAEQEDLGDLKLYRIPEPVTVAAQSQKQVAMINRPRVKFEHLYTGEFDRVGWSRDQDDPEILPAERLIRLQNRSEDGLGVPLPAGQVAVFDTNRGLSLLVGEDAIRDYAVGQEVEIDTGGANDLTYEIIGRRPSDTREPYTIRVTNARGAPESFEMGFPYEIASSSEKLFERKGIKTWRVTVPAHGTAELKLSLKLEEER